MPRLYTYGEEGAPEFPLYQSHKTVRAMRIGAIKVVQQPSDQGAILVLVTPDRANNYHFGVSHEYVLKHSPQVDGYFVAYNDGYLSYSPAEAFEGGYTAIAEPAEKPTLDEQAARLKNDLAQLDNWFSYHAPVGDQAERYTQLRAAGKAFAEKLVELCPLSADRTHAIRVIRDAVFWANASIACGGK